MKLSFSAPDYGPVILTSEVPANFSKQLFRHSISSSCVGPFGQLLFQELNAEPYNALHSIYRPSRGFSLDCKGEGPALKIHVILKKDRSYNIKGIGDIPFKEGQFNIIYVPFVEEDSFFEQGSDYCSFSYFFREDFMQRFLPVFPLISGFLMQMREKQPTLLMRRHGWVTVEISRIIQSMLHCRLEDAIRATFFEIKLQDFIINLLSQLYDPNNAISGLNGQNIDSVLHARYIIETHTGKELAVAAIAKLAGVNVYKLKTIFRQFTGLTISSFMLTARLTNARTMLRATEMPVKEIAQLAGYNSMQSFITAFKRQFNNTPGGLRQEEAMPLLPEYL